MKSKRFFLNALLLAALLTLVAFSCWYANQPAFGYALYAVISGDKAYYTLRAIDILFFYVCLLYTFRAHETGRNLVCRLLLEKKK